MFGAFPFAGVRKGENILELWWLRASAHRREAQAPVRSNAVLAVAEEGHAREHVRTTPPSRS
jgi:hypothetical protein